MKRLSSYTIIELLISLLISAIVITIAFYSYSIFNSHLNSYRRKSNTISQYLQLQIVLKNDFENAEYITDSLGEGHIFLCRNNTIMNYIIGPGSITRRTFNSTDSFKMRTDIIKIAYVSDSLRLITALSLKTKVADENITFTVAKKYTSKELMTFERTRHE